MNNEKKFYCKKCDFYTNDKFNFQRHKQTTKHKSKFFSCMYCDKKYKFKSGLSRHIKRNHADDIEIEEEESTNEIIEEKQIINLNNDNKEVKELIEIIKSQQKQIDQFYEYAAKYRINQEKMEHHKFQFEESYNNYLKSKSQLSHIMNQLS